MKDHVFAFCFSFITLWIAFVVAFCVSKLDLDAYVQRRKTMKDHVFAFCFSFITLWIAFVVAFCVSKLGGITDFSVFVITVVIVWFLEFVAAIWISRR